MVSRLFVVVLGVCALLSTMSPSVVHAATERRVALIIGNDSYKSLKRLDNGANDARAMAAELKAAGFETVLKVNAGRKEMHNAIDEFGGKLASGSVGLFYYAGHGIQAGDKNFLVPVDADLQSEGDLVADAIDVGRVMQAMEAARNRLNIVILDACRDNPLPKGGRGGSRGLAVVQAPTGTLVAYATGPGKVAQDGDKGANGIYTGELVKALRQPGLKIEDVFKQTAAAVMERTGGRQVPWTQASLSGDFYFRAPEAAAQPVVRNESTGGAGVGGGGGNNQAELLFWQSIKDSKEEADFNAYLKRYRDGEFADLARIRVQALKKAQLASVAPVVKPPAPTPIPTPVVTPAPATSGLPELVGAWSVGYVSVPGDADTYKYDITIRAVNGEQFGGDWHVDYLNRAKKVRQSVQVTQQGSEFILAGSDPVVVSGAKGYSADNLRCRLAAPGKLSCRLSSPGGVGNPTDVPMTLDRIH